jgi:nitroimidazol reductase NimA-like FMN-containing flavoprotein (pyridoxamine 5'-phosphate oxidase superfamily)
MGVRLEADEAWAVLASAHTGILTTLRRDGMPIALPVWFVVLDRTICLSVPARTKKVARIRHDPRASFLVESGLAWRDLEAVHLTGTVEEVEDLELIRRIDGALDVKYGAFRTPRADMPERTRAHYADRAFLRLHPDERILSWDNRRLT